jgi:hypothetical protein
VIPLFDSPPRVTGSSIVDINRALDLLHTQIKRALDLTPGAVGGLAYAATSQSIPSGVATQVNLATVDRDDLGVFASNVITVPAGVSLTRVTAAVLVPATAIWNAYIRLNSVRDYPGNGRGIWTIPTAGIIDIHTAVLQVSSGDVFDLMVIQSSGGPLSISTISGSTWICWEFLR